MQEDLTYRSEFLGSIFEQFISKDKTVLEIGEGDGRNVNYLKEKGYNVEGIDKLNGTAIEDVEPKQYDVIYTMSCLFLIPPENDWVFEKIANMAKECIITIEGETSVEGRLWGRNYTEVFKPFGFTEKDYQTNVFNQYGVARILWKN